MSKWVAILYSGNKDVVQVPRNTMSEAADDCGKLLKTVDRPDQKVWLAELLTEWSMVPSAKAVE